MKNHSFFLESNKFNVNFLKEKNDKEKLYELYSNDDKIYILIPITNSKGEILEISYPMSKIFI